MFPAEHLTAEALNKQAKVLGGCNQDILERSLYALTLLGRLVDSGLPFVFKGGTSLLLHLPQVRRLSIDIDIVCGEKSEIVNHVVAQIGQQAPFIRVEEDDRQHRDLPRRRHFKFFYRSAIGGQLEVPLLLDVVEETRIQYKLTHRPIQTSFLKPEREVIVQLPTLESLLGDKLTAFAPTTIGVPLRKADGTPGEVMQVTKQLFDIGVLFEAATNFAEVVATYDAIHQLESEYRGNKHTREASLNDTLQACLALTAHKPRDVANYVDAPLLQDGFKRLRGHLIWPGFAASREPQRTIAARAAVMVAHLQTGVPFDFAAHRYTNSPEQLEALRTATLNGTPLAWIDGVRAVNPEAYYYWHRAIQLGQPKST
jgi:predicted nucleotidyltransferase component of viral defense system